MTRSAKKGPYVNPKLLKKVLKIKAENKQENMVIKTYARNSDIPPEFVNMTFGVHNGRKFQPVFITEEIVGHKLGEFAPTRYFPGHGGKLAKKTAA